MSRPSGLPDQNYKPSLVLFDNGANGGFAWEGDKDLGVAFVQILDGSGNPIVTFGSPTEYDDGGTPPTHPTGPTLIWNDAGVWKSVSDTNPLPVSASIDTTGLATDTGQTGTNTRLGEVQASPTANTILDRLKTINTTLAGGIGVTGTFWQTTQPVSGTFWQTTQPVSITTVPSHAVTNAGTFVVQENGSALTSLQLIDDTVLTSDDAIGSATPKGLVLLGHYSSSPAKISASNDAVSLKLTQEGKMLDVHSTVAADTTNINANFSSAQTNTSEQSAPGANKRIVVVEIIYSRDTAGNMKLVEDPAGTPATKFGPHYFPANGGMVSTKCYIPLTTNKALGITSIGGGNETLTARTIIENV